jgi:glutamate synthase domain-containing protein 3
LHGDYESRLQQRLKFDPTRYIGLITVALVFVVITIVVAHQKHQKRENKELNDPHAYAPNTVDGHDQQTIKNVQKLMNPEVYGESDKTPREIFRKYDSSAFTSRYNYSS